MNNMHNVLTLPELKESEFKKFQALIYKLAKISISDAKRSLVAGRLSKRIRHYQFRSYDEYYQLVTRADQLPERQIMIDLLTTNETYFFREPKHFDYLRQRILPGIKQRPVKVWSAASSTGAEPYTLAMVLEDTLGRGNWEIFATDISSRVLETAKQASYPMDAAKNIPKQYLHKYCLKGVGDAEGTFRIDTPLRNNVRFAHLNLNGDWPDLDSFHIIFLRNVMIYFDHDTKAKLVAKIARKILPQGYFVISHSETLHSINSGLKAIQPSIYQKP